jgi:ribonuclease P protein component
MRRKAEALPREARITKKSDFERAKREGLWMRGDNFDVVLARSTGNAARLGVIVPLYSHNVVERNLLKRRIKEVMRRFVLPERTEACDIVVRARKQAYGASFDKIRQELEALSREGRNKETGVVG